MIPPLLPIHELTESAGNSRHPFVEGCRRLFGIFAGFNAFLSISLAVAALLTGQDPVVSINGEVEGIVAEIKIALRDVAFAIFWIVIAWLAWPKKPKGV
jgi:hypothetical protein